MNHDARREARNKKCGSSQHSRNSWGDQTNRRRRIRSRPRPGTRRSLDVQFSAAGLRRLNIRARLRVQLQCRRSQSRHLRVPPLLRANGTRQERELAGPATDMGRPLQTLFGAARRTVAAVFSTAKAATITTPQGGGVASRWRNRECVVVRELNATGRSNCAARSYGASSIELRIARTRHHRNRTISAMPVPIARSAATTWLIRMRPNTRSGDSRKGSNQNRPKPYQPSTPSA